MLNSPSPIPQFTTNHRNVCRNNTDLFRRNDVAGKSERFKENRIKSILRTILLTQLALSLGIGSSPVLAQTTAVANSTLVTYRLQATQTIHFDDARKAELHLEAVKKLG